MFVCCLHNRFRCVVGSALVADTPRITGKQFCLLLLQSHTLPHICQVTRHGERGLSYRCGHTSCSLINLGWQGVDKIPRSLKKGLTAQKFLLLKVVWAGIEPGKPASQARALTTRAIRPLYVIMLSGCFAACVLSSPYQSCASGRVTCATYVM